jgi:hypothetical protein
MSKKEEYKKYIESDVWKKLRKKAYKRAKNKCELCGKPAECVHHIKYPKNFSEDELDNLLVCCRKCHEKQHGIKDGGEELLIKEIKKRINYPKTDEEYNKMCNGSIPNYDGFNMCLTTGDDKEINRFEHFRFIQKKFTDYMPKDFKFDDFKLYFWKGTGWWGNEHYDYAEEEFGGWESWRIILWIIQNYGKYYRLENTKSFKEAKERYLKSLKEINEDGDSVSKF